MSDVNNLLDKFGKFIVKNMRDRGIDNYDKLVKGVWKTPSLQSLQKDLQQFDEKEVSIIRQCVGSSIDIAIHDFLFDLQSILTRISKLSLFIGNLLMSIIIFFYISFLRDLCQLEAGVSLWHTTIFEVYILVAISLIGTMLGFITKRNHMKKICAYTILGYLLSILSINAYYHKWIYFYFPMQMLVGFICILPFIISFPYVLAQKDSLK